MLLASVLSAILAFFVLVHANTEKTIFVAPERTALSHSGASLAALDLPVLTPDHSSLRTFLPVSFANKTNPYGEQSWYLLSNLQEGQRHEVRICWIATQPSEFQLQTFTLSEVFDTPKFIQELATFSEQRSDRSDEGEAHPTEALKQHEQSILFLRVFAAADYFTLNETLMRYPEPVKVDIILDPFLLNAIPQSLLPTIGYICIIAVVSYFVSGLFWKFLHQSLDSFDPTPKTKAHTE